MNMIQLKCPNCNADLNVENNLDSFYCQYCGTKILLQGQNKAAVLSKGIVNIMDKYGELQKEKHERQKESQKETDKAVLIFCGICGAVMLICFLLAWLFHLGIL